MACYTGKHKTSLHTTGDLKQRASLTHESMPQRTATKQLLINGLNPLRVYGKVKYIILTVCNTVN